MKPETPGIVVIIRHEAWNVPNNWKFRLAVDTTEGSTLDSSALFAGTGELKIRAARGATQQLKQFALQWNPPLSDRNLVA